MKNAYKKLLAYILVIVIGIMLVRGIKVKDIDGSRKFVEAFSETAFKVEAAELNIWGEYMPKYMQMDDMGVVVNEIATGLGVQGVTPVLEQSETKKTYTLIKTSLDATTKIQFVETITPLDNKTYQAKNYLVVNIVLHNKCQSITYFQELLGDYFKKLEIRPTTGLTITASKAGAISVPSAEAVMTHLVQALNGDVKSVFLEDEIKSIYGYTKDVKDYVTANGEKINMDLSVTYNELEDKTYLYGAIPVITFEY